jgi:hypothetical protein
MIGSKREVRGSGIVFGGLLCAALLPLATCGAMVDAKGSQKPQTTALGGFVLQMREPISETAIRNLENVGASVYRRYQTMPMVAVKAPLSALKALQALPEVQHVSPDLTVHKTMEFAAPAVGAQGGAWSGNSVAGYAGYTRDTPGTREKASASRSSTRGSTPRMT